MGKEIVLKICFDKWEALKSYHEDKEKEMASFYAKR